MDRVCGEYVLMSLDGQLMQVRFSNQGILKHRVPCLGFVLQEETTMGRLMPDIVMPLINQFKSALTIRLGGKNPASLLSDLKKPGGFIDFPDGTRLHSKDCVTPDRPGRKLVILGDTCDSSSLIEIAKDADILIHESTNACLKVFIFYNQSDLLLKATYEKVEEVTIEHGHSTPQMAGKFCKLINSKLLILNHFSSRYSGERDEKSCLVMNEIRDLASEESGTAVICAYDLFSFQLDRKP
jgi:ribonuclease Z